MAALKVAFQTLGCKVNYYESEALKGAFRREGFELVDFQKKADVYVINTCSVTHLADRKSRQAVRRAKRRNPAAIVAVTGCYPQVSPDELISLPEADIILGTGKRLSLPGIVRKKLRGEDVVPQVTPYGQAAVFEDLPWVPEQERTRAFLKIQDGCNQFCSYCIIPLARGPLRSLQPEKAMEYLREMGRSGHKEVILTGIRLGLYGIDLDPPRNLAFFLNEALKIPGIERIRLSSIEPADFNNDLIMLIKENERICRHLHIPLQSGSDAILKKMGRSYDTAFYRILLEKLRRGTPGLAVSTDIIVGFPGEESEHFQQSYDFVKESAFSRLHVFKYSPRHATRAAAMTPQVAPDIKELRSRELIALGEALSDAFREQFLGQTLSVLFERELEADAAQVVSSVHTGGEYGDDTHLFEGLSSNYLRVCSFTPVNWRGKMGKVRIEKKFRGYLQGTLLEK